MLYKFGTFTFMATTAAFATLYFNNESESLSSPPPEVNIVSTKTPKLQSTESQTISPVKVKAPKEHTVIRRKDVVISSHPELSEAEIDLMLELRDSQIRNNSRHVKREHPFLFERLDLDEEGEKGMQMLIGERRMLLRMRPDANATDEEKEAYKLRKEELLATVDDKISGLVGDKFDAYVNYREKPEQYQHVSTINKSLKENGAELNIDQQDQLATMMHTSRESAKDIYDNVDWRNLHKTPEKAQNMLDSYKDRIEIMKEDAGQFLDDTQRTALDTHLASRYERFSKYINRAKNGHRR